MPDSSTEPTPQPTTDNNRQQSLPIHPGRLPAAIQAALTRARRLEWITLGLRLSVLFALFFSLGQSQALHAIWLKNLWSLWPPIAFLLACRIEHRPATPRFPYGFHRAGTIAFLSSSLALTAMGGYLLTSGLQALIAAHHPDLGPIWGRQSGYWDGWLIIATLAYSIAVPTLLGRFRRPLAARIHDKGLFADATMGRMDWLSGGTAIIGVLGVGLDLWWADFVATLIIGGLIAGYGIRHLHTAICDLIDEVPRQIGSHRLDPLGENIRQYLISLPWVREARVRLREEGRLLAGVALIRPLSGDVDVTRLDAARAHIESMDWRLLDCQLVPVGEHSIARYRHGEGNTCQPLDGAS